MQWARLQIVTWTPDASHGHVTQLAHAWSKMNLTAGHVLQGDHTQLAPPSCGSAPCLWRAGWREQGPLTSGPACRTKTLPSQSAHRPAGGCRTHVRAEGRAGRGSRPFTARTEHPTWQRTALPRVAFPTLGLPKVMHLQQAGHILIRGRQEPCPRPGPCPKPVPELYAVAGDAPADAAAVAGHARQSCRASGSAMWQRLRCKRSAFLQRPQQGGRGPWTSLPSHQRRTDAPHLTSEWGHSMDAQRAPAAHRLTCRPEVAWSALHCQSPAAVAWLRHGPLQVEMRGCRLTGRRACWPLNRCMWKGAKLSVLLHTGRERRAGSPFTAPSRSPAD